MGVLADSVNLSMCPFCGNRNVVIIEWSEALKPTRYFVRCEPCDIVGPWSHDRDEAISKWNWRVLPLSEFDR